MFWRNRRGATVVEYCLIAGIVSLAIVAGATSIGTRVQTRYLQPAAAGLS